MSTTVTRRDNNRSVTLDWKAKTINGEKIVYKNSGTCLNCGEPKTVIRTAQNHEFDLCRCEHAYR